jgi:hypothetical protein
MIRPASRGRASGPLATACGAVVLACWCFTGSPAHAGAAVYKWVDDEGVTHLSSERPPSGIKYERMAVGTGGVARSPSSGTGKRSNTGGPSSVQVAAVSQEQLSRRTAAISELQNRECVVALEAIDRMAHGRAPVEPAEFRRLQQTADATCSKDPSTRRQQEEQAARLRVSKGDVCIDARNKLADMLETGRRPTREQLKTQQEFIESHCRAPVR